VWTSGAATGAGATTAAAPATAAVQNQPAAVETSTFDLHPPVVLMKGNHEPTFFISWKSQREVVASLGWKSGLMIWGGPTLAITCIYILIAYFGRL
jgi:hypothetical protein